MPFDPLDTDEKLDKPVRRRKTSFEGELARGFFLIIMMSIGVFIWGWIPFFLLGDYTKAGIFGTMLIGWLPLLGVGALLIRKFGAAGLSGFLGGSLPLTVFYYLTLAKTQLRNGVDNVAQLEFDPVMVYLLPGAWLALSLTIGLIAFPWGQFKTEAEATPDR